jgi:hypothetical protein
MSKVFFESNGMTSLLSVDQEEDLQLRPGGNINPPPGDGRCSCCKRHITELKSFGKAGDPLVGDFDGAFLVKRFRTDAPYNEVIQKIYDKFFENCQTESEHEQAEERLVMKYSKKLANNIIKWALISGSIGSSWECRDCICLDEYAFEERISDNSNPPEKCDCCGRDHSKLSPFKEGDPVMDHFKGKLLARRYRLCILPTKEADKILNEFFGTCITYEDHQKAKKKLIEKYGKKRAENLWTFEFFLNDMVQKSWECTECIILDTHQYLEKKRALELDNNKETSDYFTWMD